MPIIEIRENEHEGTRLYCDGASLENVSVHFEIGELSRTHIYVESVESTEKLTAHKLSEFPGFDYLTLKFEFDWLNHLKDIAISHFIENVGESEVAPYDMFFAFGGFAEWGRSYSFTEYFKVLSDFLGAADDKGFRVYGEVDEQLESFAVIFENISTTRPLNTEIARCAAILHKYHEETEAYLTSSLYKDSVMMQFDFPEEVRVPCEQYLLYFAQFLRDLGVQADTALTHEAGQVLFTVTPDDKERALDKIRAALEVYLHLPSSPMSNAEGNEIAVLRLNSELQSLQSKFSLARAEIQMKDAAIQLQKVTIAQLTGEVVFESLKDVTPRPKDKDKEELLGDLVSLVPLKGKGFEVNLPELFRKLKQLFKREE